MATDGKVPDRLYLGNLSGLWRSDDGGGTWTPLRTGPIYDLSADAKEKGRLVMSDENSIFVSIDAGATWTDLDPGSDRPWRKGRLVRLDGNTVLFGTSGGGVFWQSIPASLSLSVSK